MYKMTDRTERTEDTSRTEGTGGLVNVGFTCYANAAIQAFRHTKGLEELMNENNYTKFLNVSKYTDTTKQFANIVQNISRITNKSSIRPNGFWNAFKQVAKDSCFEHLIERAPHDAGEFLMFLLDCIHESLSREVVMNITLCNLKSEKQIFHQKSLEAWKTSFEKHFSPLVNMYFGMFHVQIICKSCNNISNRWEPFNTLKGVINKNDNTPTLIQCIHGELNEELIEDYSCDKCSPKRTTAVRKTKVWKLPETLIVILKRFSMDGNKIHTAIEPFDETLNFETLFYKNSPNIIHSKYMLRSIIDHHGSANGGHYTAQAKHRKVNKWFLYDDDSVNEIKNPILGNTSYIFFFELSR